MPKKLAAAAEATARAIDADLWEPMAGMVKRLCPRCRYFFASPADSTEPRCADCAALGTGVTRNRAWLNRRISGVKIGWTLTKSVRTADPFDGIFEHNGQRTAFVMD